MQSSWGVTGGLVVALAFTNLATFVVFVLRGRDTLPVGAARRPT